MNQEGCGVVTGNKKRGIALVFALCLVIYLFMTPKGALRLGIAISGHPASAFTSEIAGKAYDFYTEKNEIGYSLKNPPLEQQTEVELQNWIVRRYGIFYIARYFGFE